MVYLNQSGDVKKFFELTKVSNRYSLFVVFHASTDASTFVNCDKSQVAAVCLLQVDLKASNRGPFTAQEQH